MSGAVTTSTTAGRLWALLRRLPMEGVDRADVVVLLTDWGQFRSIDPARLGEVVAARCVVDGRHTLDAVQWGNAGWRYRALGKALEEAASCGRHPALATRLGRLQGISPIS